MTTEKRGRDLLRTVHDLTTGAYELAPHVTPELAAALVQIHKIAGVVLGDLVAADRCKPAAKPAAE